MLIGPRPMLQSHTGSSETSTGEAWDDIVPELQSPKGSSENSPLTRPLSSARRFNPTRRGLKHCLGQAPQGVGPCFNPPRVAQECVVGVASHFVIVASIP